MTTLLSHYWQDRQDEIVAEAALADWMDDLEPYPEDVISHSIGMWRRMESKRPTPAALIALCRKRMPKPVAMVTHLDPEQPRCSPEQAERNRALITELWPDLAWKQEKSA